MSDIPNCKKYRKEVIIFMKFFTRINKVSAVLLSAMMIASTSTPVLAAETDQSAAVIITDSETSDDTAVTTYSVAHPYQIGSDFVNIPASFGSRGGIFSVIVEDFAPNDYQMDIIMNGRNGTLWQEDDCLHSSSNRAFECSSEVRSISLRIIPRNRLLFPARPKTFTVKASW